MTSNENCKIWATIDEDTEKIVANKFNELLLLTMCRVFKDKESKKEIEPYLCFTTQDDGGTDRHFFFTFDQLTALIDQLSAFRIMLLKHTAKVYDKQYNIKHKESSNPFKGDNLFEIFNNLCDDFQYQPNKSKSNDSRRKRKG